eukprot:2150682-Rhodomonas_salina.3
MPCRGRPSEIRPSDGGELDCFKFKAGGPRPGPPIIISASSSETIVFKIEASDKRCYSGNGSSTISS